MSDFAGGDAILALRRRYAANLPTKVEKAAECVGALLEHPADSARCQLAQRTLHSLIGSSGTYGFAELSQVARAAEALLRASLEGGTALTPGQRLELVNLVAGLGSLAASAARESGAGAA